MKMLDYVVMANSRLRENLARAVELTDPLVKAFTASASAAVRIVASGSSRHSADCARDYMQDILGMQVAVVTPEAFIDREHVFPRDAFTMVISQSGFSTNSIAALDFIRGGGCGEGVQSVAITGNPSAPIRDHADVVVDYGVGVESVDFVTMGVQTLVEFLMLFALYASHVIGRISGGRVDRELRCFESAFDAHAAALRACEEWMDEEKLTLSRRVPACVVGNGPNYGVAEEGALKLNECIKIAAMHSEGEEFVHGPQMQLTPDSLLFMLDDPRGSERLANLHAQFRTVTKGAFFITAHPRGIEGELAIPAPTNPLMCAIPNLVAFQYLAAQKTEELERWEMHPYVRALRDTIGTKADGYEDSIHALEERAKDQYGQ